MNAIKRKLNNKDGVTILIALVGFMVASMIAIVIVAAASSSALRVINDRKTNQSHLTLVSAAQIVQDGMENTTYTYTMNESGIFTTEEKSGTFKDEMETAVKTINTSAGDDDSTANVINLSLNGNDKVKNVKATYIMKTADEEKYWVYFTFTTTDSKQEVYLTMASKISPKSDGSDQYVMSWKVESLKSIDDNE